MLFRSATSALPNMCVLQETDCQTTTPCPEGQFRCYGSASSTVAACVSDYSQCTDLPCPAEAPYRCPNAAALCVYDQTKCNECPTEKPFRCQDGSCTTGFSACPCPLEMSFACIHYVMVTKADGTVVRVEDGRRCVSNSSVCDALNQKQCPREQPIQCWNGECKAYWKECPCPPAKPFRCEQDLACVENQDKCTQVCDTLKPYKCWDGACVDDTKMCTCPPSSPVRCTNGRCVQSAEICDVSTSCPSTAPVRCWDQVCVATARECTCPTTLPVRCIVDNKDTGICVATQDKCPGSNVLVCPWIEVGGVKQQLVRCPDGSCKMSLADCSTFVCPPSMILCPKSTICELSIDKCPPVNVCPADRPYQCPDFSCAVNKESCATLPVCGDDKKLCPDGVTCVASGEVCHELPTPTCPAERPNRCVDGTCRVKATDCPTLTTCPEGWVLCASTKECKKQASECVMPTTSCPDGQVRCPDGTSTMCVLPADAATKCPTQSSCPDRKSVV